MKSKANQEMLSDMATTTLMDGKTVAQAKIDEYGNQYGFIFAPL